MSTIGEGGGGVCGFPCPSLWPLAPCVCDDMLMTVVGGGDKRVSVCVGFFFLAEVEEALLKLSLPFAVCREVRLGRTGVDEIKCHPFFHSDQWTFDNIRESKCMHVHETYVCLFIFFALHRCS